MPSLSDSGGDCQPAINQLQLNSNLTLPSERPKAKENQFCKLCVLVCLQCGVALMSVCRVRGDLNNNICYLGMKTFKNFIKCGELRKS